jgi:formate-dependent phosphoribosylglycinamide formyltransferase (GAR transformylase)
MRGLSNEFIFRDVKRMHDGTTISLVHNEFSEWVHKVSAALGVDACTINNESIKELSVLVRVDQRVDSQAFDVTTVSAALHVDDLQDIVKQDQSVIRPNVAYSTYGCSKVALSSMNQLDTTVSLQLS